MAKSYYVKLEKEDTDGNWYWEDAGCGCCGNGGKVTLPILKDIIWDSQDMIVAALKAAEELGYTKEEVMGELS